MKALLCSLTLVLALLPPCARADDYSAYDRAPRLTLYFRINLGSLNRHDPQSGQWSAPRFGLRLDRDLPFQYAPDSYAVQSPTLGMHKSLSMLDLQFSTRDGGLEARSLRLGGAAMMSSDGSESTVWTSPWLWVGVGVGILAISCASDNWPCDSGSDGMGGGGGGGGY